MFSPDFVAHLIGLLLACTRHSVMNPFRDNPTDYYLSIYTETWGDKYNPLVDATLYNLLCITIL